MFVVTFAGTSMKALKSKDERQLGTPWFAFFKPWNAVRDSETYSLTYLTPSVINGIEYENGLPMDSIVRSKLSFRTDGMGRDVILARALGGKFNKISGLQKDYMKNRWGKPVYIQRNILTQALTSKQGDDEMVFQVTEKSDAQIPYVQRTLVNPVIYLGFDSKEIADKMCNNVIYGGRMEYSLYSGDIEEMTEDEFNAITGVETFPAEDDITSIFCGFNRYKNNEKMYIKIVNNQ